MAHLKNKTIKELNEKDLQDRLLQLRTDLKKLRIESSKGTLRKESGNLRPTRQEWMSWKKMIRVNCKIGCDMVD